MYSNIAQSVIWALFPQGFVLGIYKYKVKKCLLVFPKNKTAPRKKDGTHNFGYIRRLLASLSIQYNKSKYAWRRPSRMLAETVKP